MQEQIKGFEKNSFHMSYSKVIENEQLDEYSGNGFHLNDRIYDESISNKKGTNLDMKSKLKQINDYQVICATSQYSEHIKLDKKFMYYKHSH